MMDGMWTLDYELRSGPSVQNKEEAAFEIEERRGRIMSQNAGSIRPVYASLPNIRVLLPIPGGFLITTHWTD